jgi:hypothetical protein
MAKNKNTFEKRRKEVKRMQKAQEKRERRLARRKSAVAPESTDEAEPQQASDPIDDSPVSDV